jgi:hypothetical protein
MVGEGEQYTRFRIAAGRQVRVPERVFSEGIGRMKKKVIKKAEDAVTEKHTKSYTVSIGCNVSGKRYEIGDTLKESDVSKDDLKALKEMNCIDGDS